MAARKPYHGSCHCGLNRYVVFLTLPPSTTWVGAHQEDTTPITRSYKCNCSICHKTGCFHVRCASAPHDFILLSPLDLKEFGDYTTADHMLHFYFCKRCGVRCFTFRGEGEVVDADLEELGVERHGVEKAMTKVWRPKAERWKEDDSGYLSVNALTLEQGQEGLDLRVWIEEKVVGYGNMRFGRGEVRLDRPHDGGAY